MNRLILVLATVLVATQGAAFIGGYRPVADQNSQFFQNALAFVRQVYPEVKDWEVASAGEQVVSGLNYRIVLRDDKGEEATAKVYVSFGGDIKITEFKRDGVTKSEIKNESFFEQYRRANPNLLPLGAYEVTQDFDKPQYKWALDKLYSNNAQVRPMQILKVELQIVQGANYRFTVADDDNSTYSYIVFVPLNADLSAFASQSGNSTLQQLYSMNTGATDVFLRSNWSEVNDSNEVIDLSRGQETELDNWTVISARESPDTQDKFAVIWLSPEQDQSKVVQVDKSLDPVSVKVVQVAKGVEYEASQIEAALQKTLDDKPQLSSYTLEQISSLWVGVGLKLQFTMGDKKMDATLGDINALDGIVYFDL